MSESQPEPPEAKAAREKKQLESLVKIHQRLAYEGQWLWNAITANRPEILRDLADRKVSPYLCTMDIPDTLMVILDGIHVPGAANGFLNGVIIRYILEHVLKEPTEPAPNQQP